MMLRSGFGYCAWESSARRWMEVEVGAVGCNGMEGMVSRRSVRSRRRVRQMPSLCSSQTSKGSTRSRSAKRERYYQKVEEFHGHFRDLIVLEHKAEVEEARERRSRWSRQRLELAGESVFDLDADSHGELFGNVVVQMRKVSKGKMNFRSPFKNGDLVDLYRNGEFCASGVVIHPPDSQPGAIYVSLMDGVQSMASGGQWRLDKSSNDVTFERCLAALDRLKRPTSRRETELERILIESFHKSNATKLSTLSRSPREMSRLRSILNSDEQGGWEEESAAKPIHLPKNWLHMAKDITQQLRLNPSQRGAILSSLGRSIALIQGPPGTGKTRTACSLIFTALRLGIRPILAVAESNVGADNLLEGLSALCKKSLLRVGNPATVRRSLWDLTVDARVNKMRSVQQARQFVESATRNHSHQLRRTLAKLKEVEMRAAQDLVSSSDVVVTTCVSAGSLSPQLSFLLVVVDEASQATEPSLQVALQFGCRQLILVGDHHQLPPTVVSSDAAKKGLEISLFSRLASLGLLPSVLNVQYRMHIGLAEFPSKLFYAGCLKTGWEALSHDVPSVFPWPNRERPLAVINVKGTELSPPDVTTYSNEAEADLVASIVTSVIRQGEDPSSIGVICFYAGQLQLLCSRLGATEVEIKTCDGFQGREKDLVILSTVRSNDRGELGFVDDWRRLNVSLTRAKKGLVVVGNVDTLRCGASWRQWLKLARADSCIIDANELVENLTKAAGDCKIGQSPPHVKSD